MMNNPYLNAAIAFVYITCVVLGITAFSSVAGQEPEDSVLMPIVMLSLLVLSVATMAFLFFYRPLSLLVEGKNSEAVSFFVRTLVTFAAVTALALLAVGFTII